MYFAVTLINRHLGFLKETGLLKMEEKSEMVKTLEMKMLHDLGETEVLM